MVKSLALAVVLCLSIPALPARATDLAPVQTYRHDFAGGSSLVVYYMPERDGFHVVATFEAGAAPTQPVLQVGATLTAGQSIVVALPGAVGGAPDAIRIARHGNTVVVKKATGLAERD